MKIAIIGTRGVPANYGGYETLVENLITYKKSQKIDYTIYCSSFSYKEKKSEYKNAKLEYIKLNANGWQSLFYASISMFKAYFSSDVILSLGTGSVYFLPIYRLFSKKKTIFHFDGMDQEREKFSFIPKLLIKIARKIAARYGDAIIADNTEIRRIIKEKYNRDSILIEYGGDHAQKNNNINLLSKYNLVANEYFFKVARIEPENKIELILDTFITEPDKKFVLVGNWNVSKWSQKIKHKYSTYSNLLLIGPIYEQTELNVLRSNCVAYIHGHSVGGTNPSLVEAMYLGLPILSFAASYNVATTENKALYFNDKVTLKKLLSIIEDSNIRENISKDLKEVALRRYTWEIISDKYENLLLEV